MLAKSEKMEFAKLDHSYIFSTFFITMPKRKKSQPTQPTPSPTPAQVAKVKKHQNYEAKKDVKYNKSFFEKWKESMLLVFNHSTFDFAPVAKDFEDVAGDVSLKLFSLHAAIIHASESSGVNIIPCEKAFHAGSTWARFVPTASEHMQEVFESCAELCEQKCKQLSPEERKAFKLPGIVFFDYLPIGDVQRVVASCQWLTKMCQCISETCLIQVAIMGDFVDNLHTDDYPHYPHHDLQFSACMSCSFFFIR